MVLEFRNSPDPLDAAPGASPMIKPCRLFSLSEANLLQPVAHSGARMRDRVTGYPPSPSCAGTDPRKCIMGLG
jgi:hypothetical protein